jgi:aspartyl-tRNA(Asn)/glutamyl-tRNA(Gln) amidotransferase subunit A
MSQWLPIAEISEKVNSGQLKAVDLVNQALKTIEDNKDYNAIISTTAERALQRAAQIDQGAKKGRLSGVPFVAKDNFLAFGSETTAGSNMLKGFNAPYQATAIEKLEAEGAICVAKANLDAFAHGSSTENSDFGVTKNPYDKSLVAGGSSGGSAASVALDFVPFALGSDTGGSIRLPASFCGCVGYKPTYGLVSRSGVVAMASSLDVIGPLARTIDDTALVLDVIAGRDNLDSTTIERDLESYTSGDLALKGQKIGVIKEYLSDGLDSSVKQQVEMAIEKLRSAGAEIIDVSLPSLPLALAVYYIICPAEVSSNLSRYDGTRYGYSDKETKTLDELYVKSRGRGFGAENKRRIIIGTHVLSSGYYEAYYKTAQTVRTKLINEFEAAFGAVDFLLGPVTPTTAFKIGSHQDDPMLDYLVDIMTVAANLVGIPAISLPIGSANELPVGLQLMGRQKSDRQLLALAKQTEELIK